MAVIFGKGFVRSFSVEDAEGRIVALDSIVSGRIYSDAPSEAQIEDDNDALGDAVESVTSWDDGDAVGEKLITYSALTDSDEHAVSNETYYEVVSYKFESGGTTKRVARAFTVIRPHSIEAQLYLHPDDISSLESEVYNTDGTGQKSLAWVNDRIDIAKGILLRRLRGMGVKRHQLREDTAQNAFLFLATAQCCISLSSTSGDIWQTKHGIYMEEYEAILKREPINIDADGDDHFEIDETRGLGTIFLMR